ncbi:MAG: mechanosensitive ion channel [Opitutales bacterium]|nr:mechanosensitive ion channel [Opitutales bacterium]NRA27578.1 mechanosensitive ion channel [Opitutales bacterium]
MNLDLEMLQTVLTTYGLKVIGAIITLIVGFIIAKALAGWTRKYTKNSKHTDTTVGGLFSQIVFVTVMLFTVVATLHQFGVETTSLVAALGAAGLAVGLALQGTLSNVAAGVMVLILKPFKVDEVIKVGDDVFVIDDIGLIASRAHTPDGPSVFIPNSKLWGNVAMNLSHSHNDLRRFNETFGIAYSDDIGKAIAIINKVLDEEDKVQADPERLVEVTSLGDSSVNIIVWAWVPRADWWTVRLSLMRKIKEAFDTDGITIPFPQTDVHLIQDAG